VREVDVETEAAERAWQNRQLLRVVTLETEDGSAAAVRGLDAVVAIELGRSAPLRGG